LHRFYVAFLVLQRRSTLDWFGFVLARESTDRDQIRQELRRLERAPENPCTVEAISAQQRSSGQPKTDYEESVVFVVQGSIGFEVGRERGGFAGSLCEAGGVEVVALMVGSDKGALIGGPIRSPA